MAFMSLLIICHGMKKAVVRRIFSEKKEVSKQITEKETNVAQRDSHDVVYETFHISWPWVLVTSHFCHFRFHVFGFSVLDFNFHVWKRVQFSAMKTNETFLGCVCPVFIFRGERGFFFEWRVDGGARRLHCHRDAVSPSFKSQRRGFGFQVGHVIIWKGKGRSPFLPNRCP